MMKQNLKKPRLFPSFSLIFGILPLLAIYCFFVWILNSYSGLSITLTVLQKFVPGQLHVEQATGTINREIQLHNITYQNKNIFFTAQDIDIIWKPINLITKNTLTINSIAIHDGQIKFNPPMQHSAFPSYSFITPINNKLAISSYAPHLPINIDLQNVVLRQFHIIVNQQDITIMQSHAQNRYLEKIQAMQFNWQLSGLFHNYPLQSQGNLAIDPTDFALNNFEIQSDGDKITGVGNLNRQWQAHWQISIKQLQHFLPNSTGQIDSTGNISGDPASPIIQTSISAQNLHYQTVSINSLEGKFLIDPTLQNPSQIQLNTNKLLLNKILFDQLTLKFSLAKKPLSNKSLQIQTQLDVMPGQLNYTSDQKTQTITFLGAQLQAQLNASGITSNWYIKLPQSQQIYGDLNLPSYHIGKPLAQQNINGHIHVNPIPLNTLQQLLPDVINISGVININSILQGTVSKPIIIGQLQVINGQARIPALNINLTNLQLRATGQPTGSIDINGNITSNGGQLTLSGKTSLQQAGFPTKIQIQGNHFLTVNTLEYRIFTSPQLNLQIQNGKINLTGKVFIPEATIRQTDFKTQSVVIPSDVVFVKQKQQQPSNAPFNFYSQIQLILGDKINVKIMGLKGQLLGNLNLMEDPQRFTTATGTLSIKNGTYKAYGQNLTVTQGHLIYTGGTLSNPGLAIKASRQLTEVPASSLLTTNAAGNPSANTLSSGSISVLPSTGSISTIAPMATSLLSQQINLTVGINVEGTLNDPQITLFSEPANLSQSDILSYLIFGQPASQASTANAQFLYQAASSLNLGSGQVEQITQQLQQKFGLTQLSVGSAAYFNRQTQAMVQYTSLMLGKKLTPHLFVNYSVGLNQPINILQVTYLLTSHWSIQSSTSSIANGVDIIYSIERN